MSPMRYYLTEEGELRVTWVEERPERLSQLDPIDIGVETDSVELEGEFGASDES